MNGAQVSAAEETAREELTERAYQDEIADAIKKVAGFINSEFPPGKQDVIVNSLIHIVVSTARASGGDREKLQDAFAGCVDHVFSIPEEEWSKVVEKAVEKSTAEDAAK